MDVKNLRLEIKTRQDFRTWLSNNHDTAKEIWLCINFGKPINETELYYLDCVEEAICFGWIDSTRKKYNGITIQKFMSRNAKSNWTELNKARWHRLNQLGLMTDTGRKKFPFLETDNFIIDDHIKNALKMNEPAWTNFQNFPIIYQRIRINNIQLVQNDKVLYTYRLNKLVESCKKNQMYGQWDDYGRLQNHQNLYVIKKDKYNE